MSDHPAPFPSHRIGRAAFLGLAALTTGALLAGRKLPSAGSLLGGGSNVDGFTIYTIANIPEVDPASFQLHVGGLVDEPRTYSYHDLLAMPAVHETRYFQCVTGWSVPHPRWTGVRLWDLVAASRPISDARALHVRCLDQAYTESLTLDQARQADVLLAYGLNGHPLSRDQGFPLRLVVPGMYGYKFAKWVNHVEVVDRVMPGYWEQNGYDVNAYIGHSNGV
ncbi:MAG TPA: molybdopterin-dependent oxidoreductase [Chloroflexota bacterium]|nr:molybdopterin-dependent oxidoreductase [Chloroflexota bacterium]